jgi:hypothetical protein
MWPMESMQPLLSARCHRQSSSEKFSSGFGSEIQDTATQLRYFLGRRPTTSHHHKQVCLDLVIATSITRSVAAARELYSGLCQTTNTSGGISRFFQPESFSFIRPVMWSHSPCQVADFQLPPLQSVAPGSATGDFYGQFSWDKVASPYRFCIQLCFGVSELVDIVYCANRHFWRGGILFMDLLVWFCCDLLIALS